MTRALVASAAVAAALALWPAAAGSAQPPVPPVQPGPAATGGSNAAPPNLQASAAIVIDAHTGQVIWSLRPDARRAIASTTKLMTALLTLERSTPGQMLTSPGYSAGPEEVTIGLAPGERMSVHDLLLAMLLPSANDAALTLAHGIGGTTAAFVGAMNARAAQLGLAATHYSTPIGLDSPTNYSTARDLSRLGAYLLANPTFAHDVDLPSAPLRSGSHPRVVVNRNGLVARFPFVKGIKTGHTQDAGYVLVGAAAQGGAEVVTAVLGDPSEAQSDTDSLALMRYGLSRYANVAPIAAGQTVTRPAVRYYGGDRVALVATRGVALTALRGAPITLRVNAPRTITGPKPRGAREGSVTVYNDGRPVATVPLVTAGPVKAAGFIRRLGLAADAGLAALACLLLGGAGVARVVRRRRAARGERAADDHHSHAQRGYR